MNRKLLIGCACLLAAITHRADAAQIIINNLSGLHPITNPSGDLVPLGTGSVRIGTIELPDGDVMSSPSNRTGLIGAFTAFGTSVPFGAGGSGGFYTASVTSPITAGDLLIGQNIYIVAGDGTTLANSTGIFIFKSDKVFEVDAPTFNQSITLDGALAEGTILVGTPANIFIPLAGNSFDGSQMVAFLAPEPGTGLLLALSGLVLCSRRRRR